MTVYDAAMAVLVVAGMVWGAWRGITWQLASIASLVLGYGAAHQLSGPLAQHFHGEPVVARAQAMLLTYVAVSGGVFLVAWLVRSTLRRLRFEAFDRHLGMLLGGLEGALLGLVATLFVVSLDQRTQAPIFASPTGRVVSRVLQAVGPVLPDEARKVLAPFWMTPGGSIPMADDSGPATAPWARQDARDNRNSDRGPAASPTAAKFEDLIEEGESRLGRALVETAEKGLQATGSRNDRGVERR